MSTSSNISYQNGFTSTKTIGDSSDASDTVSNTVIGQSSLGELAS